jgi:succinate dehydrogenase / fumarate reductase, iron-sulfur subunit
MITHKKRISFREVWLLQSKKERNMKVTLRIQRFNPESDKQPYFQDFEMEVKTDDRLLDALMAVKTYMDGTLAFRKSCAHGICGSDGMVINGVERLACKTLIKDVTDNAGNVITLQPLKSLPLQRDLMVDYERFFENYRIVKPYLINNNEVSGKERLQSPEERYKFDDTTKCILCAACFSACPVENEKNPAFIGPAAIVQAARFVFDSRDMGFMDRLDSLDNADGVWACENRFNCTKVCPRGIKVTRSINLTKNRIKEYKESRI